MASTTHARSEGIVLKILGLLNAKCKAQEQQERFTRRARSPPVAEIVNEVLSDSSVFRDDVQASIPSALARRIIVELGRQHSAEAAYEAFQWFKGRAGGQALESWCHACITACVWNGDVERGLALYHEYIAAGNQCPLQVFNILIAACGRTGRLEIALELLREAEAAGLDPNTFTYMTFMEACNYKGCGKCDVALALFSRMLQQDMTVPDVAKAKLVAVVRRAIRKADTVKNAVKAFVGLQLVGLERDTEVYNCLLHRVAKDKEWDQVLQAFRQMLDAGVPTDSDTYSALLGACIKGNRVAEGFQIFEWMVAGCGEKDSIPNTPETLQHLFQGCHQAGALEKALEVLSWMQLAHTKPTPEILAQTEDIIDLAQLWDKIVFRKPSETGVLSGGPSPTSKTGNSLLDTRRMVVIPETLRPAPYDGNRTSYLSREMEQFEDAILSAAQLKDQTWIPATMQPLAVDHDAFGTPPESRPSLPLSQKQALHKVEAWRSSRSGKKCSLNLHATWVPPVKRFSRAHLNPHLSTPNKVLERTIGYSTLQTRHWASQASKIK